MSIRLSFSIIIFVIMLKNAIAHLQQSVGISILIGIGNKAIKKCYNPSIKFCNPQYGNAINSDLILQKIFRINPSRTLKNPVHMDTSNPR